MADSASEQYLVPKSLNPFQKQLYEHLIRWKRQQLPGVPAGTTNGREYDAILPQTLQDIESTPLLHESARSEMLQHRTWNPFRLHKHFGHMASSQAANANLLLPILKHPAAADVLRHVRSDFASLAVDRLNKGYCLEYWGSDDPRRHLTSGDERGLLGDKSAMSGTDSDIAIAYRDHSGELRLWLIEHKLTEAEFTACGGARSKGRTQDHSCELTLEGLLSNKKSCYYHSARRFHYWNLTEANKAFFQGAAAGGGCPFKGGMNQLWRNQLLALAIEHSDAHDYKRVTFSVVKHPANTALDATLAAYKNLVGQTDRFSSHDSTEIVRAAETVGDADLIAWAAWYRKLYNLAQ